MRLLNIFLFVGLFLFSACGNTQESIDRQRDLEPSSNTPSILKTENIDMLQALNSARAVARDCHDGLGMVGPSRALKWNDNLYASAYEHSRDLALSNTFSHSGSGTEYDRTGIEYGDKKSQFFERIENNGYTNYYTLGENIGGGQSTIDEVMEAWLESPAHCTNIMNDEFEEVAIAVFKKDDSDFEIYWTQNFGTKF